MTCIILSILTFYIGVDPISPHFVEVTKSAGIAFTHTNGADGAYHLPETLGAGGAFFDYDNDDNLDLFLVNSGSTHSTTANTPYKNVLYRNNGDGTFTDVTEQSNLDTLSGYNHGVVAADYDNDSDQDLYITSLGANHLYRNNGDGTFTDTTELSGIGSTLWSSSATFFDYDLDGYLDLYVVNYVYYRLDQTYQPCIEFGYQDYCNLRYYEGAPDQLYRNNGDGTFTDVTKTAGINDQGGPFQGKGLGVIASDLNNDGFTDLYVANDGTPNYLFYNNGDGTFTEIAAWVGCAYSSEGLAQAGMGVDAGDYNGDGLMDIFVTNFSEETNNLYRNNGDGTFTDTIYEVNLGDPTYLPVGFGTGFFDYDNDSDLDIFVANGHVTEHIHHRSDLLTYGQRNQLFQNDGLGKFVQMSPELEKGFLTEEKISRGSIFADYDNDGDVDLLVTQLNQPAKLYRNQTSNQEKSNNWLQIKVVGVRNNRNGFGARMTLQMGNLSITKETRSSSGYLSSHDPRVTFGIGQYQKIESLTIYWPSGSVQRLENISVNQQITVVEETQQ